MDRMGIKRASLSGCVDQCGPQRSSLVTAPLLGMWFGEWPMGAFVLMDQALDVGPGPTREHKTEKLTNKEISSKLRK